MLMYHLQNVDGFSELTFNMYINELLCINFVFKQFNIIFKNCYRINTLTQ